MSSPYLMNTYARFPVRLVKGQGSRVWDDQGKCYLDFISGIAVNTLGHAHPALAKAVCRQAETLVHCSNLFHIPQQEQLAEVLCRLAGLDAAFFCNSGAEANEAAIKLARRYWHDQGSKRRTIITAVQSFHGRTLNTLSATGQDKVKIGFDPLMPGFLHVPYGDLAALEAAIDDDTAAIMLEPVQGEGGVNMPGAGYLAAVRELCDTEGVLLILDEIQTGIGRTGSMFAFQHEAAVPDILSLAKGLGSGFPVGAMLAKATVAAAFTPGSHGTTFGGNPLACAAALAVLDTIEREHLVANARTQGERLSAGLKAMAKKHASVCAARGLGLIAGLQLDREAAPVITACRDAGLLLLLAGPKVIRFLPPLNVSADEIDEALAIVDRCLP
ncbi:MAG TPA: acetylornithine transaminase [Mariprofundaceae bacterium]|nr:acetylornithine transaminase [Mariprofundaceae bacterium]